MAATLRDLAAACGCTPSTASRALRGDGRISAATVARIRAEAERIGYRPNLAARTLVTGRSRTVLFLLGGLGWPTNYRPAQAAARRLHQLGWDLLVATHHGDADAHDRLVGRLEQGLADGVLIAADDVDRRSSRLAGLVGRGFPVVFVDRHAPRLAAPVSTTDNATAAAALVDALADAGAAWIADGFRPDANPVEAARARGCAEACRRRGLPRVPADAGIPERGPLAMVASGEWEARPWLHRQPARRRRRMLIGIFDLWPGDPPPGAEVWTCEQDFAAMARAACDRLLLRMEGRADPAGDAPTLIPAVAIHGPSAEASPAPHRPE